MTNSGEFSSVSSVKNKPRKIKKVDTGKIASIISLTFSDKGSHKKLIEIFGILVIKICSQKSDGPSNCNFNFCDGEFDSGSE